MGGKRRNNKNKDKEGALSAPSKAKSGDSGRKAQAGSDDSDVESIATTHLSLDNDLESVMDGGEGGLEELEKMTDDLDEFIENAAHKTASIRVIALKNIAKVMQRRFVAEKLEKWKLTIVDLAERALKRADEEITLGADIASLAALQYGNELESEMEGVAITLRILTADATRTESIRTSCALALGIVQYMCSEQPESHAASLKCLRDVWTSCKVGTSAYGLFSTTLASWCLLLRTGGGASRQMALGDEARLCIHVEDASLVEVRIAAGEAISVLFEFGTEMHGDTFRFANHAHLVDILNNLATDSFKYRAKRDRRVQRFTFRQILHLLTDGITPSVTVKFGEEKLELSSCYAKLCYDQICQVLRGGINCHLQSNRLLRDEFDLGPPVETTDAKISKSQRMLVHNAIDKVRTQHMSRLRDKRNC